MRRSSPAGPSRRDHIDCIQKPRSRRERRRSLRLRRRRHLTEPARHKTNIMYICRVTGRSGQPGLAALLTDHPFDDDAPLISTTDRTVTAGETRAGAADVAARLRAQGLAPGQAVVVQL